MKSWSVHLAKASFGELLRACVDHRPQTVTKDGVEVAALVAACRWCRLTVQAKPELKTLLFATDARADFPIQARRKARRRPPVECD